jgi:effector-binding domain-containing protein
MITPPEVTTTQEVRTAAIPLVIPGHDMPKYMDPAIHEIINGLAAQGMRPAGPMFTYHKRRPTETFDFEVGFPVSGPIRDEGRVKNSTLPAAKVVRAVYKGPYDHLPEAWGRLQAWVRERQLSGNGHFFERYLNHPGEVKDPKEYLTELNWVVEFIA